MCTVSWLPGPGGYLLCFNRDENRARRPGLPPTRRTIKDLEVLAPTDADAGGTWIGVNSAGLALCLANLYGPALPPPVEPISRGLLLLGLLGERRVIDVQPLIETEALVRYRPFTMIAIEPDVPARIWSWDGAAVVQRDQRQTGLLVTSSAVDQAGAEASRRPQFAELFSSSALTTAAVTALHQSHRPARDGLAVCMHRTDAQTVSLTRVEVTTDTVAMAYSAGSPCHTPLAAPLMTMRQTLRARD